MKKIIIITLIAIAAWYTTRQMDISAGISRNTIPPGTTVTKSALRVVYYADVSKSNLANGVELGSSKIFEPYFKSWDRNIEVNFGCIANVSAKKLITVNLPGLKTSNPSIPDLRHASITNRRELKEKYQDDLIKYHIDSTVFSTQREVKVKIFAHKVDSILNRYRRRLTNETDLATAITIADKTFAYSKIDHAQNILILNSDGEDSKRQSVTSLQNKATVLLVNASGKTHSSIDPIITLTLQSPEAAIQYSLNK